MKEVLNAIRSVEPKQWDEFFETLRHEQYKKITGVAPEELPLLQATVKSLHIIEEKFKALRDGKISLDFKTKN